MSRVRSRVAISLDGFIAGPNQSLENPLGVGGTQVHEWAFALAAFRKDHGLEGGEVNASTPIVEKMFEGVGAGVMGRNMFGGQPGPWNAANPWNGWWGKNPPYHHPVFVVTHHARPPLELEGGNRFHFVTEGFDAALAQARQAAAGQDVSIAGGAQTLQHFLRAGLIDDMILSVAPVLLGSGERLLDRIGTDLHGLKLVAAIPAPNVTHLKFAR
jgi:dihydrofolate reductase